MPSSESRPANVIVAVAVSYLVGLPTACCLGVLVFGALHESDLGGALMVAIVVAALVVPGVVAWWWNYRRRPPTDLRPWR